MDDQAKNQSGSQAQSPKNELKQQIEGEILRSNSLPADAMISKFSQVSHLQDGGVKGPTDLPVDDDLQEQIQEFATRIARAKGFEASPEPSR